MTGFCHHSIPQFVLFGEALFDGPRRIHIANVTAAAAVVTSVNADSFAEKLIDGWFEGRATMGQVQASEGQVCSLQRASQGADVVGVWCMDSLFIYFFLPKMICF